jgi:chromate transporter
MAEGMNEPLPPPGLPALFTAFLRIGLMGFGGVGPVTRYVIVEDRRWLDDEEYGRLIGLCQALPGANSVNAAVILGDRYAGLAGAATCLLALMAMPLTILVMAAIFYEHVAGDPLAQAALTGAAASAAGLILGTAIKLLLRARLARVGWVFAGGAFVATAALRVPLPWTLAALVPPALLVAVWAERRR